MRSSAIFSACNSPFFKVKAFTVMIILWVVEMLVFQERLVAQAEWLLADSAAQVYKAGL